MPPRAIDRLPGVLATLILLAGTASSSASPERGFPLIQAYSPAPLEAESQNLDIARDPAGVLYIGNVGGVLVYDGAWWQVVPVGKAKSAWAVAAGPSGRVGVGGKDEIGYLKADASGSLRYVSLRELLPPEQRELGQVLKVHPTPSGFLFLTTQWLLSWDGSAIRTVATFPGDRPYADSFGVNGTVFVWTREGLFRLAGAALQPVAGGDVFRGRRIDQILPADRGLLISVREEGLFLFQDALARPFAPEASRWTTENRVLQGCRLADGRWVLGSLLGGILLLRPDGTVDQVIGSEEGLPDDFVTGIAVDREGSLWLSLNNGLARVEVRSPASVVDARSGLKGTVYAVVRHRGELWAGTSAGLFRAGTGEQTLRMRAVPGLPVGVWSFLSADEDLLAGTAFGIYLLRHGEPRLVEGTDPHTAYTLVASRADPGRVWAGTEDGLFSLRRAGSSWRHEGFVKGVPRGVRQIVESGGVLWCGTQIDGIVKVEMANGRSASEGPVVVRVPNSDDARPFRIGGKILVVQGDRLLCLNETRGTLVADPALAHLAIRGESDTLVEDAEGNLWCNTRPVSVAVAGGAGWRDVRTLVELPARTVVSMLAEPEGPVWLATDKGLFRYAGSFRAGGQPLPPPRLARIAVGGGDVLFGGAPGIVPGFPELPSDLRRLRIELGPLSYRAGLRFQTWLDPVDSAWGDPAAEPFAELTRLPSGSYTFHARTAGPNGETGPETVWAFRVLPPWYRTPWALALAVGLAVAVLRGFGWLRSFTLSRRAALLEARVAAQTQELRHTLGELQRANDELEVANERLEELSLQDALTGLANRRRLQQVLEDEWARAQRSGSSVAFALLDLDHFKLLNDTRGHREGDRALQVIARYLADSLRRTSDLVARYGGEELAILLPDTDLRGALKVSEQVREGIEKLAIPHLAAPSGRITASVGVAVMAPEPGRRLEELVEAADLALYRAKRQGRNRVCAAERHDESQQRLPIEAVGS
ncbi:MAG TPA: diguanylate cyclase [Thermoanaerobaculia bacterium]|nr:diguanylate cyclase [Thermoanaerobaculia bacterium]